MTPADRAKPNREETMNSIEITYDKEALTKSVLDALASNVVGQIVTRTVSARAINAQDVERSYDWAVQEVTRKVFFDMLASDEQFKLKVKAMISERLTNTLLENAIKAVEKRIGQY